jgi:hypothetical protein
MGLIRKLTLGTGVLTGLGMGYLGAVTTIISPLPEDDPLWRSKSFAAYNSHRNPSTQDVCIKRIPLSKIKPELLQHEGDLALEFCRGVWGGLGERSMGEIVSMSSSSLANTTPPWGIRLPVSTSIPCR